ncbi:type IV toxin-antitoxin system AbiEi family antitoxin domain-containing protein [Kribbella catacumbae]|uniref:type IV toxin-antitoxin system AbiEi family antitoxin domain-containing protein n=1 Tax=Kribbella catacumbae TaxID=460086 RepID=UPI0003778388|nr:type IV toxin-antitoxin system AbiEi family antitoxin domain-containing protein [Kribbella catacumbae]
MNPKLRRRASEYGDTFNRQDAVECGYTVSQIRERLRDGRWISVRRGFYAELVDRAGSPPWERQAAEHRLAVHAAARALAGSPVVISHQSAAVLHGLPTWGLDLDRVHVTRTDRGHGRILARTSHHVGELPARAVTTTEGLPTTTIARSVVDASCSAGYEVAVALCDGALQSGRVTKAQLSEELGQMVGWPGTCTAQAAVAFADGRSESVGESRLRVLMDTHGLPEPELQVQFSARDFVARVDFYFRQFEVIVEFDGLIKYRDDAVDAVVREKHREDRLRSAGVLVVRVTWDDLNHPDRLIHRIRQAFALSERRLSS